MIAPGRKNLGARASAMTTVCDRHGRVSVLKGPSGALIPQCPCYRPMPKGWEARLQDSGDSDSRAIQPLPSATSSPSGSSLERAFDAAREAAGIPPHDAAEYVFAPPRKFRADRVWLAARVLVELHGSIFQGGAHSRGWGIERDCEKTRLAATLGWRVVPITSTTLRDKKEEAMKHLRLALEWRPS